MPIIRSVLASIKKADETFTLIDPGDKIVVGISGGKDSMALLYALHLYTKFSRKDFQIFPVTLDLGFPGFDPSAAKEYAARLGYELKIVDSKEVYPILLTNTKPGHHVPCSICSRMKKAAINSVANDLGCNKVAFAHHQDDALETLWMNMIHAGSVSTFEPKMHLDRAGITFIRPLIFAKEEQLSALCEEESIPVMGKTCPADGYTERQYCKDMLLTLYKERPEARANLGTMLYDYSSFRLYFDHVEYPCPEDGHLSLKPLLQAEEAITYSCFAKGHSLRPLEKGQEHLLLLKDHRIVGIVSFILANPHQISITAFDYALISEEEAAMLLRQFEAHYCRKINPLHYFFFDENHIEFAASNGYAPNPSQPLFGVYAKRYSR